MDNKEILGAILSKDSSRLSEAKLAIKEMLNNRATAFKDAGTKFISKSIFESTANGVVEYKPGDVVKDSVKGIVGVVKLNTNNSGHPQTLTVKFNDEDESVYTKDDFKNLVPHNGTVDKILDMIRGNVLGAGVQ